MKLLLAFVLALAASMAVGQQPRLWFVLLTTGDAPRPAEAEVQRMQREHLQNFDRLHREGRLLMAGPLRDPTRVRRGIVALWVPTMDDVKACFGPDPYIQSGLMKVEATPWHMDRSRIGMELPDPNKIEENRFVVLKARRAIPEYLLRQHRSALARHIKPALDGKLDADGHTELLFFSGADDAALRERLALDPLVRLGWVEVEILPWYTAKGVLKG